MLVIRSLLPLILAGLSSNGNTVSARRQKHASKQSKYEVWGSDQSNSVSGQTGPGAKGSFLWIWDSSSIEKQLMGNGEDDLAKPLSCEPLETKATGPCDLLDVFPRGLTQVMEDGTESGTLGELEHFGRLHGMLPDPMNRYVTANIFTPQGGYVGIIDTETKGAIALFRVAATEGSGSQRSVHMSLWSEDGTSIVVDNLHGKMIERIDVERDNDGTITNVKLNQSASVYLGKNFILVEGSSVFKGKNAFGKDLVGEVVGSYGEADTGNLTPAGVCKESGCDVDKEPHGGGRPNNVPICPITSLNGNGYVTLGGGGLFVLKIDKTPMKIIGEYGSAVVNGAGCGGAEANGLMFLNAGTSASDKGTTQSAFTVYAFDDSRFDENADPKQNYPMPIQVFKDSTNTRTIGNVDGTESANDSGQKPSETTRRDSHGMDVTDDGAYVHVTDRIQNVMEVFDTRTFEHVNTYDLVSLDGKSGRSGPSAACRMTSVLDDAALELNDPAPDLLSITPDGKYLMIAFRGPKPVSVKHAAQGSCPGVGIVEITDDGKAGKLVGVLRSHNIVDTVPVDTIPGGYNYAGAERSDIHGATVIKKGSDIF